jgi:hypothetical protein
MSLRNMLGADAGRVHEQLDTLLDGEDAMIVLVDGSRAISYAHGFGTSPSQLELLALEIERAVRTVAAPPINNGTGRRTSGEECANSDDSGRDAGFRRDPGHLGRGENRKVVDRRNESVRPGGVADSNTGRVAGRVLRLAREAVATESR